ncbi:MAG: DUF433 domain-containing protein [Phycisphaerales bacterium]|nr:DUF433 domain-containing protein [Phycisphaerales bacterium]
MDTATDWRERIRSDPAVHHGDPCVGGTRVPVSVIVGSVADGDTFEQIMRSYPQLAREDIQAALLYAAEAVNRFDLVPISK